MFSVHNFRSKQHEHFIFLLKVSFKIPTLNRFCFLFFLKDPYLIPTLLTVAHDLQ